MFIIKKIDTIIFTLGYNFANIEENIHQFLHQFFYALFDSSFHQSVARLLLHWNAVYRFKESTHCIIHYTTTSQQTADWFPANDQV